MAITPDVPYLDAEGRLATPSVLAQLDARTDTRMRDQLPTLAEELGIGGMSESDLDAAGVLRVSSGTPGTPDTTRPSVNLADPSKFVAGSYTNSTTGARYAALAGYTASAPIPVEPGAVYSLTMSRHLRWEDAGGAFIAGDGTVRTTPFQTTAPANASFLVFSWQDAWAGSDKIMAVKSETYPEAFEPYGTVTVPGTPASPDVLDLNGIDVRGLPVPEAGLSQAEVEQIAQAKAQAATVDALQVTRSPNLYDSTQDKIDFFPNGDSPTSGSTLAGYRTSAPIPVTAGQDYTISMARSWYVWDANGARLATVNTTPQSSRTLTIPAGGVSLTFAYLANATDADPAKIMVVEGTAVPSTYTPYGDALDLSGVRVSGLPEPVVEMGKVKAALTSDGATLTITTELADGKTLRMVEAVRGRDNGVLNHMNVTVDGATVHPLSDDIAPIRTQHGTIGANHGFAMLHTWPAEVHSLTTADLGSVWSDGARTYILLGINAAGVAFLGAETTNAASGEDLAQTATPAGDLTRQGGTAGTLAASARQAIGVSQMWPAVQRVRQVLLVDGSILAPGETRTGTQVQVRESYEVLDYTDMLAVAKANPGVSYADLPVRGAVRFESVHTWRAGGTCAVDVALTEMRPTKLNACGLVQSVALAGNTTAGTVTRYVPGVIGWTDGVDLSTHSTTKLVGTADLTRPGVPPVMSLDVRSDVAFALGVHPWRPGVTTAAARLAEAPTNLWDLRSTDKSYPTVIASEAPGWGRYEGHAYRVYMTPAQAADIVAVADDAYAAHSAIEFSTTLA